MKTIKLEISFPIQEDIEIKSAELDRENNCTIIVYGKEEKEEKFLPKRGDILYCSHDSLRSSILIAESFEGPYISIIAQLFIDTFNLYIGDCTSYETFRPATPEEQQLLFDALAKEGKRWNADTLQLEDIKDCSKLWKDSIQLSDYYTHEEALKACPVGYRLPTKEEFEELITNTEYSFDKETEEGVFTFKDGFELRLQATGSMNDNREKSLNRGTHGYYWSNTQNGTGAYYIGLGSSGASTGSATLTFGFSVRCIKK
ncbi:hypothetical protein IR083_22995 [Dysgonomonas sp. GY75]|uniref:FISUMP domain-containing protein n=1 Tax=Dysgonomonas sp. GY75 TaxID=2780419 RepID=UPI0018840214|nr:FISUMP domain-containing protein [Dysgonomonas sp. GY75]MBF0651689.1 hypothetical protein [Dysgonomonas sp. GY75]